jgi:hypothetical protein
MHEGGTQKADVQARTAVSATANGAAFALLGSKSSLDVCVYVQDEI